MNSSALTWVVVMQMIRTEEQAWGPFRRALHKEDRILFDLLWVYCRRNAQAASMVTRQMPFETFIMSMLIGILREMESLRPLLPDFPFAGAPTENPAYPFGFSRIKPDDEKALDCPIV